MRGIHEKVPRLPSLISLPIFPMANQTELRHYLACWFQLGKTVQVQNSGQTLRPNPVMKNGLYSDAFEDCWQQFQVQGLSKCFLDGTNQNLAELLEPKWELNSCARCTMPVAHKVGGITDITCPCTDLPGWPNTELPTPRGEQDQRSQLQRMKQRVYAAEERTPPLS